MKQESALEDKYWVDTGNSRFEFYPATGKVIAFSDGGLLKAVHHVGMSGLDIDWSTLTNTRSFLVKNRDSDDYRDYLYSLNRFTSKMDSKVKQDKIGLLNKNIDNKTGKPLNINSIRVMILQLRKDVDAKKKSRKDITLFFNRFNIEEDEERIQRGAGLLEVSTKHSKVLIDEGKDALERMFKKGKLRRLTKEELTTKMRLHGKEG